MRVLFMQKLFQRSFEKERFKMALLKFYDRDNDLVDLYDVSLFKITKTVLPHFRLWFNLYRLSAKYQM